jgi:DNA-binding GntR family transcriptional regulator
LSYKPATIASDGEEVTVTMLEVPSLVDAVQQAMRVRILDGKVPPGTAVTEISVANEFSVARTTAKAAVERLVHDGLLRRAANKSARVPVLDLEEVRDVYFSRGLLEATVIQRLAVDGKVPEEAKAALRRFDAAVELGEQAQVVEADIAFHRSLVDSLGSERFSRVYQSLMGEAQLCMAQVQYLKLLNPKLIATEHASIVAAIEARDPVQAVAMIDTHLKNASTRIVAVLQERPVAGGR